MRHLFTYLKTRLMYQHFFARRKNTIHSDAEFEKEIWENIGKIKFEISNLLLSFRITIPEKKDIDAMLQLIDSKFESLRNSIRIRYQSDFRKAMVNKNIGHQKQLGSQMVTELSELHKQNKFLTRDIEETRLDYNWKYFPIWVAVIIIVYLGETYFNYEALIKAMRDSVIAAFLLAIAIAITIGITNHFFAHKVSLRSHPVKKLLLISLFYFSIFYFLGVLRTKSLGIENPFGAYETLGFVCISSVLAFGASIISIMFMPNRTQRIQKQRLDELKKQKQEIDAKIEDINLQLKTEPHVQNREMIDQAKHIVFEKTLLDLINSECEVLKSELMVTMRIYANIHNNESNHLLN